MDNSVDYVSLHLNPQKLKVFDGLENRRFSQYPDRGFGTKDNKTNQILCNSLKEVNGEN